MYHSRIKLNTREVRVDLGCAARPIVCLGEGDPPAFQPVLELDGGGLPLG